MIKLDRVPGGYTPVLGVGSQPLYQGESLAAIGWGVDESGQSPAILQMALHLSVHQQSSCNGPTPPAPADTWVCAGGWGQSTCAGNFESEVPTSLIRSSKSESF